MTTFISVGNGEKPFSRLLENLDSLYSEIPKPIIVQRGNTNFTSERMKVYKFIDMKAFYYYIHSSRLIICHAGAGTIIHAIQANKVPVVMPRLKEFDEIVDNHQLELSNALEAENKVVVANNKNDFKKAIKTALKLQDLKLKVERKPNSFIVLESILEEYSIK